MNAAVLNASHNQKKTPAAMADGAAAAATATTPASTRGRRLLVAVDDSPESEHALSWALENVYR